MNFHPVLKTIIEKKIVSVNKRKNVLPLETILPEIKKRDVAKLNYFKNSIKYINKLNFIGECKKSAPIRGVIRKDYNLEKIVEEYFSSGASAISVLTEENFFYGDIYHLFRVRESVTLPILRKDFIIDSYQIYESAYFGADAILLIVKLLSDEQLEEFYSIAKEIKLDVIFEVHTIDEIDRVLKLNPEIVGINNRDLESFNVNIFTTVNLRKYIPENIVVISESGIKSKKDIEILSSVKIDAVLIGTYFMESENIKEAVKQLGLG